jgi:hypothetical protein
VVASTEHLGLLMALSKKTGGKDWAAGSDTEVKKEDTLHSRRGFIHPGPGMKLSTVKKGLSGQDISLPLNLGIGERHVLLGSVDIGISDGAGSDRTGDGNLDRPGRVKVDDIQD